jgi:hypothetical protein
MCIEVFIVIHIGAITKEIPYGFGSVLGIFKTENGRKIRRGEKARKTRKSKGIGALSFF